MSLCRQQGFIEAPIETVWELISDVERHPEWWPRVVEVECEGLEEGCTYRQVEQTPFGKEELDVLIEARDEYRRLNIRCINTGTFVRFALTEARGGTFLDGEMGMDPQGMVSRVFDAVAGRRYFSSWMTSTLEALGQAARGRGEMGDPGLQRAGTASDVRGQDSPRADRSVALRWEAALLLSHARRRSPDNIAAARMSCSGEAFSIPGIERSTRRWQHSRD